MEQKNIKDELKSNSEYIYIMLPFDKSDIAHQYGPTCKITAIATLDRFFARKNGFLPIPVHKNAKGVYGNTTSGSSIRKLAKELGSIQGELLEVSQFQQLLNDKLGYESSTLTIHDEDTFRNTVIEELNKGQPCISFFSPKNNGPNFGAPLISDDESIEHACLITGYDSKNDQLRLTHWERHFFVPFIDFYRSNQSLHDTRQQEKYLSLKGLYAALIGRQTDYSLTRKFDQISDSSLRDVLTKIFIETEWNLSKQLDFIEGFTKKSMIPEQNTGFRGKLICISPLTPEQCQAMDDSGLRLSTVFGQY